MNRIYCAIGKIVEVTQFIEVRLGDICEKSEIIKEFSRHAKMTKEALALRSKERDVIILTAFPIVKEE